MDLDKSFGISSFPPLLTTSEDTRGVIKSDLGPISGTLKCIICTKKGNFCDESHLLTHMASKGHLHAKKQMELKAKRDGGDKAMYKVIDDFEEWYKIWCIDDRMSARLTKKDNQRNSKGRVQKRTLVNKTTRERPKKQSINDNALLDPLLTVQENNEPGNASNSTLGSTQSGTTPDWLTRPYVDIAEYDVTGPFGPRVSAPEDATVYDLPKIATPARVHDVQMDDQQDNKLKGAVWPGMDMFDSATPTMRQKRNQKKPVEVLERLQAASEEIFATEVVFSGLGLFHKARPITGFPNPSSSPSKCASYSHPIPSSPLRRTRRKVQASPSSVILQTEPHRKQRGRPRKRTTKGLPVDVQDNNSLRLPSPVIVPSQANLASDEEAKICEEIPEDREYLLDSIIQYYSNIPRAANSIDQPVYRFENGSYFDHESPISNVPGMYPSRFEMHNLYVCPAWYGLETGHNASHVEFHDATSEETVNQTLLDHDDYGVLRPLYSRFSED